MDWLSRAEGEIGDDELTALALMGDPDQPLGPDAVPISFRREPSPGLLPEWYMPRPAAAVQGRPRRWVLGGIVVVLLLVNGAGLCVTFGLPEIAW